MKTFAMVLGALALVSTARADEAKKYSFKVPPHLTVKPGDKGVATLKIETVEGSHVSDEAPLKITLKSDGLTLEKDKLTTADIAEGKGASPTFKIAFHDAKAGSQTIVGTATFIVCTKEMCERESEPVSIPVDVK